jgi:trigger factor
MDMHIEQRGPTESVLHLLIDAQEMERHRAEARRNLAREAQLPGFRKGKVPPQVAEAVLGAKAIDEETQRLAAAKAFLEAVRGAKLDPYGPPTIEEEKLEDDGSLRLRVAVTTAPKVTLGEYRSLPATRRVTRVTDEHVATELRRLQEEAAEYQTAPGEPIQPGDVAIINYELFVEGERREGAGAEGYPLQVGADRLFAELNQGLEGARAGDRRTIAVSFPPDYHDSEIAGKSGEYRVEVVEVKRRQLPPLDDAFARRVSRQARTVDELREGVRKSLAALHELSNERALEDELIEQAVANAEVVAPPALVEQEIDRRLERVERELNERGLTLENYLERKDQTAEELRREIAPDADAAVRRSLVLDAIGKAEGVEVSQQEIDQEVERMAQRLGDSAARVRRAIDRGDRWEAVRDRLYFGKVVDLLLHNAVITEEEVEAEAQDNA